MFQMEKKRTKKENKWKGATRLVPLRFMNESGGKKFLDCPVQYHAGIGGIVFETLGEIGPPQQTQWGENVECRTVSFTSSSSSSSFFFYFIWWIVFSADGKASHIRSLFIFSFSLRSDPLAFPFRSFFLFLHRSAECFAVLINGLIGWYL